MDMKVRSIGQEREIKDGWVTLFLLLDNHGMPCSLSRKVTDWYLSFSSSALIWHCVWFVIISARGWMASQSWVPFLTCAAEYVNEKQKGYLLLMTLPKIKRKWDWGYEKASASSKRKALFSYRGAHALGLKTWALSFSCWSKSHVRDFGRLRYDSPVLRPAEGVFYNTPPVYLKIRWQEVGHTLGQVKTRRNCDAGGATWCWWIWSRHSHTESVFRWYEEKNVTSARAQTSE